MRIGSVESMTITRGCPEEGDAPGFVFETPRSFYYGNNDKYRAIPLEEVLAEVDAAARKEGFREGIVRRGVLDGQPHYTFRTVEDTVKRTPAPFPRQFPAVELARLLNASGKSPWLQALMPRGHVSDVDSNIFAAPKGSMKMLCKCGETTSLFSAKARCERCGKRYKLCYPDGRRVPKSERGNYGRLDPILGAPARADIQIDLHRTRPSDHARDDLLFDFGSLNFPRIDPVYLGPITVGPGIARTTPIRAMGETEIRHRGPSISENEQRAIKASRLFSQFQASQAFVTTHESRHGRLLSVKTFDADYLDSVTGSTFRHAEALFNVNSYGLGKGIVGVQLTPFTEAQQKHIDEFESVEFPQALVDTISARRKRGRKTSKKKGKK